MRVRLPELGAMVRAYPPGKRLPVHVKANGKGVPKDIEVGAEVELAEDLRFGGEPHGARAAGRVVGMAWIIEVTLPEEDDPPLVDENQESLEMAKHTADDPLVAGDGEG